MGLSRRGFLQASGLAAVYMALPAWVGGEARAAGIAPGLIGDADLWAATTTTPNAGILHLLNRITFGPRPGQVAQVARMGYDAFLEQQLYPALIDDSAMERRLAGFKTLSMTNAQLRAAYRDGSEPSPWWVTQELQRAALLRAVYSGRQLQQVMTDFWSNHLNIYHQKDETRWYKTTDDRNVIRPHALGKFRNMLLASAKSPAMLVYLDNRDNVSPPPERSWLGGVNENYARELLELHTVGVDAGYTETDVRAVARAFTGWTLDRPWSELPEERANPGAFRFLSGLHDNGSKRIPFLNLTLPTGGGIRDGQIVLQRLATHPKTAQHIARKLAVQFVSDTPPPTLVDRVARAYLASDTDIRATLRVLLTSAEFKASAGRRVKLPMRALVSYARVLGAEMGPNTGFHWRLEEAGQPFFEWHAPNGYPQAGAAWVHTSGMLARWNTAFSTAASWDGVTVDLRRWVPGAPVTAQRLVDALGPALLNRPLPAAARTALIAYVGGGGEPLESWEIDMKLPHLAALILGSPAFQVH